MGTTPSLTLDAPVAKIEVFRKVRESQHEAVVRSLCKLPKVTSLETTSEASLFNPR